MPDGVPNWIVGVAGTVLGGVILYGGGVLIKNQADIQSLHAQIKGIQDSREAITDRFELTRQQVNDLRVEVGKLKACK